MPIFSFRAECIADVSLFQDACHDAKIPTQTNVIPHPILGDVKVELTAEATLDQLCHILQHVVDGHVMLQTFKQCSLSDNSLDRDDFHSGNNFNQRKHEATAKLLAIDMTSIANTLANATNLQLKGDAIQIAWDSKLYRFADALPHGTYDVDRCHIVVDGGCNYKAVIEPDSNVERTIHGHLSAFSEAISVQRLFAPQ